VKDIKKQIDLQDKSLLEKLCIILFLTLYALIFIFRIPRMVFDGEVLIWVQASAYGILGISGLFLFRQIFFTGIQSWKTAPFMNVFWLSGAYVALLLAMSIASLPAYLMGLDTPQNDANVIAAVQLLGAPLSILLLGIAGPITEEIIYRGFLIQKRKVPLWVCIILSSILFAFAHMHGFSLMDFIGVLPHFAVALVYGILYAATSNITLPLILHIINNVFAIILLNSI